MAAHLADGGYRLTVMDAASGAVDAFVAGHPAAEAAAGPEAFAGVQALILMLPNSAIVEEVLEGDIEGDGVADALPPGCLVIDMSSSEPLRTRALAARLHARGLSMLDAPVSGGVRGAKAGTLSALVGGPQDELARATPLLRAMARTIVPVGDIGSGHAAKALNNLVSAATISITVEALALGESFGISPETMTHVLNSSSGRSNTSENKVSQFMTNGSFDSGFSLRLMSKDVDIAVDLARALSRPAEIADGVARQWRRIAGTAPPQADHTEMYTLLTEAGSTR
ncbi:2-hydroxy-3-oxopropionate reductase [Acrocarpospora pleiomorpha]|uniref:2-hydroxy-3-oxopropionate reductase n=2 Tax=Acrocarpospora pleiomorpha TaxID=90975 RepID=A0A5M3XH94_9ACTN|nr:2-hydroxy-3-oxopropionate reductase [Acrocarpospora pleiomorpha]